MLGRRRTHWPLAAALALALASSAATGGAATTRTGRVPVKLLGVWHKTMTKAQWERAGVTREVGVYTFLVKKAGAVTIYRPGDYPDRADAHRRARSRQEVRGSRNVLRRSLEALTRAAPCAATSSQFKSR
jgi:hypothetical protein